MIIEALSMLGATAAVAGLGWRMVRIAKHEGVGSLFSSRAEETLLHACLLFSWVVFVQEGVNVLAHSAPNETMAGFGALFGGLFAMCFARTKTRPGSESVGGLHG